MAKCQVQESSNKVVRSPKWLPSQAFIKALFLGLGIPDFIWKHLVAKIYVNVRSVNVGHPSYFNKCIKHPTAWLGGDKIPERDNSATKGTVLKRSKRTFQVLAVLQLEVARNDIGQALLYIRHYRPGYVTVDWLSDFIKFLAWILRALMSWLLENWLF